MVPKKYRWDDQDVILNITKFCALDKISLNSAVEAVIVTKELVRSVKAESLPSQNKIGENEVTTAWVALLQINLELELAKVVKRLREAWFGFCIEEHFRYVLQN